jgi:hypothetical protein
MTRFPRSPGSTFVLRINQETIHDFILLFLPPCGPHLTPLATGSLERSLLVFSTPGRLTDNDPPVRPVRPTDQTGLALLQHRLGFFGLGFVDQPRNPVVFW